MHDDPGLFATMYSMRAMRRLHPGAVPLALVERIIEAGTQAPSGANTQPWAFVVVTEPAAKRFFGERYEYWLKERFGAAFASMDWSSPAGRTARASIDLA